MSDFSWLFPLGFLVLLGLVIALVRRFTASTTKALEVASDLTETGEAAQAEILSVRETGTHVNHKPLVAFRAKVTRAGQPPYEAGFEAVVSVLDLARVQPGCNVAVAIDPASPSHVALMPLL